MKKVILCAAALMFGSFAFAQVSGAPTATAEAAITGAATGANTGTSIQEGNDNRVRVRQAGTSNSVLTNQNDGTGDGGNLARVRQTGEVQAGISGELNLAEVLQSGTMNQSTTLQEGDENNAVTRQGQNNTASEGNLARIRQGTGQQAQNNWAAIEQDGLANEANTQQTYDKSRAWTTQVGERNRSWIDQDAGPNDTDGHEARVDQNGNDNQSFIAQEGAGATNTARAFQQGNNNYVKQTQTTDAGEGGVGNTAITAQGNGTTGFTFSSVYNDLLAMDATVGSGPPNVDSFGGIAFQDQSGSNNDADIRQFGEDDPEGNYAEQNQSGSGNSAFITQNRRGNPNGAANYARQDQDGTNSDAGISQRGSSHKAYQRQSGDDNIVLSSQTGARNLLNTFQDGDGNRGETIQHGLDNQALLVQRGGHSYTITQNVANGVQMGDNVADVLQLGPDGDFSTDAIDCEFGEQNMQMAPIRPGTFGIDDVCEDC